MPESTLAASLPAAPRSPSDTPPQSPPPRPDPAPAAIPKPGATREGIDVHRIGLRSHFWEDMYHLMLVTAWWKILLLFLALFLGLNVAFGLAFELTGGVQGAATFWELFFFSVQTFSTIGYGMMAPVGFAAQIVTTFEAFVGVLVNAFAAGIVVIKFARPTARVMFSRVMVLTRFDGVPTLMVRMANSRQNQVFDAQVGMFLLRDVRTAEGFALRRLFDLPLARQHTPFFTLTLTAMHPVDERSPLHGLTREQLMAVRAQIIVTIQGVDESFMTQVHARRYYQAADIVWNAHFADVLAMAPDGRIVVDYRRFHDVVRPEDAAAQG